MPPLCQDGAGAILGHSLAWTLLDGPGCCCKVSITRRPSSVFWGVGGASGWENYKIELCSPSCLSLCMSLCGANLYKSLSYFAITFKGSVCHHLCTSLVTWQPFKMSYDFNLFPLVLEFSLEMFFTCGFIKYAEFGDLRFLSVNHRPSCWEILQFMEFED